MNDDDLIICRCEEVTLRELREAIAKGAATSRQLKLETRIGMGYCQGRTCRALVERLTGTDLPDESTLTCRPPARPITFGQLAGEGQK
ncbi:MAG TPA: (2Fe-2S)-binding protein [Symbiobacteriaceae bacterium]|nr:(2Fe-2S)-binding protein [Symbiobacteriaceae bacterium]